MKSRALRSVGRLSLALLPLLFVSSLASAAITYVNGVAKNDGVTTDFPSPVVNATTFINQGIFGVTSLFPYETYGTLNFTNKVGFFPNSGVIFGSVGLQFDYAP